MGNNKLYTVEKKYSGIKYSLGLAILFLMTGLNIFSQEVMTMEEIAKSKETLKSSVGTLQNKIEAARKENNKEINGLRLELIQLMEQGNQVVKSPWASWQFGMNYFYDNWGSSYKGRGDKQGDKVFQRDNTMGRYQTNTSNGKYGTTDLDLLSTAEPKSEITVNASIRAKSIDKEAPNLQLPRVTPPASPQLNLALESPAAIPTIEVEAPKITLSLPEPNASPFTDYSFQNGKQNLEAGWQNPGSSSNKDYWNGYNPTTNAYTPEFTTGNVKGSGDRPASIIYINNERSVPSAAELAADPKNVKGFTLENVTLTGAGNVGGAGVTQGNKNGLILIHTVRNGTLKNVTGNLYGRTNFLSIETWHAGKLVFDNVEVNIDKNADENMLFYIYPAEYNYTGYWNYVQEGSFLGKVDAKIRSNRNIIYGFMGLTRSFDIDSEGLYELEGSGNIVYSGMGWSPNNKPLIGSQNPAVGGGKTITDTYNTGMVPSIKFTAPPKSYGDNNIILYFSNLINNSNVDIYASKAGDRGTNWAKTTLGIYQGEINAAARIGEKLSIDGGDQSTTRGNQLNYVKSNKFTENNVGIFAQSGQRGKVGSREITPSEDLGAVGGYNYYDKDHIHNLQIADIDITFGKYARNGIMIAAKNGTAIDVITNNITLDGSNKKIVKGTLVKDYTLATGTTSLKVSDDDSHNEAGTGTIIALAQGTWNDNNDKQNMSSTTKTVFDKLPSKIDIGTEVKMSARYGEDKDANGNTVKFYPIAYVADKGIINTKKTTAYGYGSVIAYALNGGNIKIDGDVEAKDAWATNMVDKSLLYKNIGAYANGNAAPSQIKDETTGTLITNTVGSNVTITGNVTINGLAALADGEKAKVSLEGTDNVINTGTEGGLFATNGGTVEFNGGTIVSKDNSSDRGLSDNDHKSVVPFYAKNNGKIVFKNNTTIEMYDGVVIFGEDSDYKDIIDGTSKYQGMNNVKVKLMKDGINLGVFKGLKGANNVTWAGNSNLTTYTNKLKTIPKFADLDPNGKSFKSTLTEGTLTIDSNVNLSDANDGYNNISMERELVTINAGKTVTGNGKGLSMGSNAGAANNSESGYINKGTVDITGGTSSSGVAGINVSYGQILNDTTGVVKVDNGVGLYGTNGSKIENKGTVTVTGSGTGIAGLGKGNATPAMTYGNGKVEIVNDGTINITGANSTAIYVENNNGAAQTDVTITNNKSLTLGDNSSGIVLKSGSGVGGLINVSGTGNSDIKVGTNGFGIYAEDSQVTLNTDYGVETADNGVGIYTTGNSSVLGNHTLNYKYSGSTTGSGIATLYSGANATNNLNINLDNSTNTTAGMVGIFANGGGNFTNTGNVVGTSTAAEFGIVADQNTNVVNSGNITLGNANNLTKPNVGIYTRTVNSITNTGNVSVGDNSIALYGYDVNHTNGNITAGNNSMGIFSKGGNISLTSGSLVVGTNNAVGVFASGANQTITSTNSMTIGDTSYGFVIKGTGHNLTTDNGTVTLGNDSVFAYSDKPGTMTNRTQLVSTGSGNYGLYSAGNIKNLADINFGSGEGNVGIYSIGGTAVNGDTGLGIRPRIIVDGTDSTNKLYGIGMAAGYYDEENKILKNTGNIVNYGTIDVLKSESIGMYAVGNGSTAKNYGTINLSGKNTVGMYLDQGAIGENHGTITTVPNTTNDGIKGVVALNGAIFKNYGNITINSPNGIGYYYVNTQNYDNQGGTITVSGDNVKETDTASQSNTTKRAKGIEIKVEIAPSGGPSTATVIRNGAAVKPIAIDTTIASPNATKLTVGDTTLDLSSRLSSIPNMSRGSEIGMYVDTSGINYTNPIQGLDKLTNLKTVNLIFGTEASEYTTEKDIEIGQNILNPYNDVIRDVSSARGRKVEFLMNSSNLTWIATATQNIDLTIAKLYLSKRPYTTFAKEKDTYNFMDGLEQRYGVEKEGTRERELFKKINKLGLNEIEQKLFVQAIDEMKGYQYANIQQRIQATGDILDKEFNYLRNEWTNPSKDSNKIKTFGANGEYKTSTAGVIDYKNNAYGVAYVHEDETVRLGESTGWYAGIVHNTFKFKDVGNSKEEMLQGKLGLFKSVPFDENNSLNWTISGDVFAGYNKMHRKFLVVDEIFNAKGRYHTYGLGLKNEISKEFRLSESFTFKPYAALGLEYGRVSKIREKSGEIKLDVKSNDYFSVKPEIGAELGFKHYFDRKTVRVGVTVAYENELGRVANGKNQAKVAGTDADYFNIRGEKDDRTGNVKTDLNIGVDNQRVGVTANVGYDTKGNNVRAGVGLRVIF